MAFQLEDHALDLRCCLLPARYLRVGSGRAACAPTAGTALGAEALYSPPFAAPDLRLHIALLADGHRIADTGNLGKGDCGLLYAGGTWYPDRVERRGTYHFETEKGLLSLGAQSCLRPLVDGSGFLLTLRVHNRGARPFSLSVQPELEPGHPVLRPLMAWDFTPPAPGTEAAAKKGAGVYETSAVRVTVRCENCGAQTLLPGKSAEARVCVLLTRAGQSAPALDLRSAQERERAAWQNRLRRAAAALPAFSSDAPGLTAYADRCLISVLTCLWEGEDFICRPFPATGGLDGGSLCCYPWDTSYAARLLALLLRQDALFALRALLRSGIDAHICMSMDGRGQGDCGYAYSLWSIVRFYDAIVRATGQGAALYDEVRALCEAEEARLPDWRGLKDYGGQRNLLEMRARGWEHVTASPNAERAEVLERLATLAERFGRPGAAEMRARAARIRRAIREELWDAQAGWFRCVHPGAAPEIVYSIQAFDALSACDESMASALLSHLRPGCFLGDYGISSVSAEDERHYELNDPDWSGGGAYSGEGPQLAEALWRRGEDALAWEVLRRHLWLGRGAAYVPQEHFCDRPGAPAHKRANCIAGGAGWEALLFGLAGARPGLDGSLVFRPRALPGGAGYEVRGFPWRGARCDLYVRGEKMALLRDGVEVYAGPLRAVEAARG